MEDITRRAINKVLRCLEARERLPADSSDEGFAAGERWAEREATPGQMRALAGVDPGDVLRAESPAVLLGGALEPALARGGLAAGERRRLAGEVWARVLGDGGAGRIDDVDFALAFFCGALLNWCRGRLPALDEAVRARIDRERA